MSSSYSVKTINGSPADSAGNVTVSTPASPSQILSYYRRKVFADSNATETITIGFPLKLLNCFASQDSNRGFSIGRFSPSINGTLPLPAYYQPFGGVGGSVVSDAGEVGSVNNGGTGWAVSISNVTGTSFDVNYLKIGSGWNTNFYFDIFG
jgi:hypothetical protein